MFELFDAAGIRRIDRSPTFDLFRMRGGIIGDDLVGHPDAGSFCLQPENDDFVHGLRDAPVVIRLGVIAVFIEVGAIGEAATAFQLYQLGCQGLPGVLIAQMIRIPEEVRVAINDGRLAHELFIASAGCYFCQSRQRHHGHYSSSMLVMRFPTSTAQVVSRV